jgi:hypothetical protein
MQSICPTNNKIRFVCKAGRKVVLYRQGETLVSIETVTRCAPRYAVPKRRMYAALSEL